MKVFLAFLILWLSFLPLSASAEKSPYAGYVSDVQAERSQRFQELYMYMPVSRERSLQDEIFNPLSREFKDRYRERFGQTDTESIIYQPTKFSTFDENRGAVLKIEQDNDQRRAFAEYMSKRLIEFHLDNYMKTQPQMKPLMEIKEQVQNVKVEVNESVRMNMQYNFAGNSADFLIDNPWCEAKVSLEMDSSSFGPSETEETRIWLNKDLNKQLKLNTNTTLTDGIAYAEIVRRFERLNFSALTGISTAFKEGGTSTRETKFLVGFSHSW